jgi:hypothetical protein
MREGGRGRKKGDSERQKEEGEGGRGEVKRKDRKREEIWSSVFQFT